MKIISNMVETHIFRVKNKELEFLLLKRAEGDIYPNVWQMVTGKVKSKEKAYTTALRELKEETGLTPEEFWVVPQVNSFYSPEGDFVSLIPVFAVKVNKNSNVKISDEHTEFKWVKKNSAIKMLIWKGQKDAVKTIYGYYTKERSYLNLVKIKLK